MKDKLPKRFKTKWLKALRSGEYKQGRGQLCIQDRYCCLGVACVIAGHDMKDESLIPIAYDNVPILLREHSTFIAQLTAMNDGVRGYKRPRSFKQIANWIEKNL